LSSAAEQAWLREARDLTTQRVSALAAAQRHYDTELEAERKLYAECSRQLVAAFDAEGAELEETHAAAYATAEAHWTNELRQLTATTNAAIHEVDQRHDAELAAATASRDETTWLVGSLLDDGSADSPRQQLARLHAQIDGTEQQLQEAVRKAVDLRTDAAEYLDRCRLSTEVGLLEPTNPPKSLSGLQERCLEEVAQVEAPCLRLRRLWLPKCFIGVRPFGLWLLIGAALAGPVWWFVEPQWLQVPGTRFDPAWIAIVAASGGALSLVTLLMLHVVANQRAFGLITEVFVHSRAAQALFNRWERLAAEELATAQQELDRRHSRRQTQRDDALTKAESEYAQRETELADWRRGEIARLQQSSSLRRRQLESARDQQLTSFQQEFARRSADYEQRRRTQTAELEAAHRAQIAALESQRNEARDSAHGGWRAGLERLDRKVVAWEQLSREHSPDWSTWEPRAATETPRQLRLGTIAVDLRELPEGLPADPAEHPARTAWALPGMFDLHDRPALIVGYDDAIGRQAATELLQGLMLRLLAELPAGQVRFTILDPVTLGENFATFMHLADVDELLVTSRIWTEGGDLESRLADLTEHMETVLQMFLRNEFASLREYNEQAGEVAEPYRVLVVSGLPTRCSELALRRLWNIVMSGARCGVIPLISVDRQVPLPRELSLAQLEPHARFLRCSSDGLRYDEPELREWPFVPDPLPEPARFGRLIKELGRLAGDIRRVEVPFHRVAPSADAVWTKSAAARLEIPIGRAGATRTQSVMLGVGTSQHVLIAGKTGSGKSTLLHALITNAALHYSPLELELYLIDFKKGVEFKVYARHQLPHVRVIGIESDREFGVSALERLDRELQERSALFREAGVADLAGFRKARPDQPMPRAMLVIDEFQEFFVEDDPLSQTAALLLDRLIRQGRAFGVHVVLGSQTLAGAYSLARSTLGQVAVRIALQCSETDAHLILSEENTAARLLTRPGEAIYNDANGLVSGNHLFQVVWLEDEDRDRYLEDLRRRSEGQPTRPAIVFEGNVPADPRSMPWPEPKIGSSTAVSTWLGEAVSLKGPLTFDYVCAPGSHLAVVGPDEVSAAGILAATVVGLARAGSPDSRCLLVNGSPAEGTEALCHELAATLPIVSTPSLAEIDVVLNDVVAELRRRDGRPGPRWWLALFDLARFRKLRRGDDDFGFGGFDKKAASPSELLAEILRDGPAVGIHVWLWADSVNTFTRWCNREMQQQLEHRVALSMNATDSSTLIDSPAASRLGANRAWLFRGDRGTLDKFRPYSMPRPGALAALMAPTP
jgi:energy-coupling factor transporter ATP-binding protein EcfA2